MRTTNAYNCNAFCGERDALESLRELCESYDLRLLPVENRRIIWSLAGKMHSRQVNGGRNFTSATKDMYKKSRRLTRAVRNLIANIRRMIADRKVAA